MCKNKKKSCVGKTNLFHLGSGRVSLSLHSLHGPMCHCFHRVLLIITMVYLSSCLLHLTRNSHCPSNFIFCQHFMMFLIMIGFIFRYLEAERDKLWSLAYILLFLLCSIWDCGPWMGPPTFWGRGFLAI